jgi:F-type H+-transporting ATPase subunit alpha
LDRNGKTLTSVPVVHAANGDITAYLPTNIMSITDGQWILDMTTFRAGIRPALSMGLSVTRAGGVGHNKRQKDLAARTLKLLADYRQAEEFSHFGSELGAEAKRALEVGKNLFQVFTQSPTDTFSLMAQQLMMDITLNLEDGAELDVSALKLTANEFGKRVNKDEEFDAVRDELKAKVAKLPPPPEEPKAETPPAPADKDDDKKHKKDDKKDEKPAESEEKSDDSAAASTSEESKETEQSEETEESKETAEAKS